MDEDNVQPIIKPKRKRIPSTKQRLASVHKKLNRMDILIHEIREVIVDFEENQIKIDEFKKSLKEI